MSVGCLLAANAQSSFTQRIQEEKQGEGKVTVTQDKSITDLVDGPNTAATPARQQTQTQPATTKQTEDKNTATNQNKPDNNGTNHRTVVTERSQQRDTTATDDGRKKVIKGGYKINGYRVQVYAGGNSRDARIKAERIGREINSLFPGESVYVHFYSPRWICRMGNYRTYEEAHQRLRAVKNLGYSSAIIVKGKITVPYLTPSEPSNPIAE
jgi:hypothetical protein